MSANKGLGITVAGSAVGLSPFRPQPNPSGQSGLYPRGSGGVTDLCTLYGIQGGWNPCGLADSGSCDNLAFQILLAVLILALLFLRPAPGSQ